MARRRHNAVDPFLAAIACGATIDAAAAKAGISPRTAHRWLKDPSVQQRLAEIKAETISRTAAMLTAACLESVKTLLGLQKTASSESVRLGAAKAVLELAPKAREHAEFEQRLAALERQLIKKEEV